jgi:nucleoside-diphosphate-sugar epimerase
MDEERKERIVVTGANGYIGSHVVQRLLQAGYSVRAVVRSQEKADEVKRDHQIVTKILDFAIVPDFNQANAFDEVFKAESKLPITAVFHLASPVPSEVEPGRQEEDILKPAINGTKYVLESTKKYGKDVKRMVLTSSFAAVCDYSKAGSDYLFSEKDWLKLTYEDGQKAEYATAYAVAKALAEKAAWDFMEKENPQFDLVTLTPPYVYGPLVHSITSTDQLNTSNLRVYNVIKGSKTDPIGWNYHRGWIDVRDLADAHLIALTSDKASNKRILPAAGTTSTQETCDVLRKAMPELSDRISIGNPGQMPDPKTSYRIDNSFSKELGLTYMSLEQTLEDFARQMLYVEERGRSHETESDAIIPH